MFARSTSSLMQHSRYGVGIAGALLALWTAACGDDGGSGAQVAEKSQDAGLAQDSAFSKDEPGAAADAQAEHAAKDASAKAEASAPTSDSANQPESDAASSCSNECDTAGQQRCTTNAIQECKQASNGCRAWSALEDCQAAGKTCAEQNGHAVCNAPAAQSNLDKAMYHQQPLSSNDDGPFAYGGTYEGWCNTGSLYTVLHSFLPDLPKQLHDLNPTWKSWRASAGVPTSDPFIYKPTTTYNVEEFLQKRYLGALVDHGGVGYSGIEQMAKGVASDLGITLELEHVALKDIKTRLVDGWMGIANNYEWGGHYFAIVHYEEGADPSSPAQRYYYVLDPTNIEAGNGDILNNLESTRTAKFRALIKSRQDCGTVSCDGDRFGAYVLNATGVNAILKTDQIGDAILMLKKK
jgi:hypothetical protein